MVDTCVLGTHAPGVRVRVSPDRPIAKKVPIPDGLAQWSRAPEESSGNRRFESGIHRDILFATAYWPLSFNGRTLDLSIQPIWHV